MANRILSLILVICCGAQFLWSQAPPDAATVEFATINETLMDAGKYPEAIVKLEELTQKYKASPIIDSIHFNLGLAYLFDQKFLKANEVFTKLMDKRIVVEVREGASFFAALSKMYDSFGKKELADRNKGVEAAIKLFTDFLDNKEYEKSIYREEALFQRTKLYLLIEKFDEVQKGVASLFEMFPTSQNRPDFYLTSGQAYSLQTFRLLIDQKKPKEEVRPIAEKGLAAFASIKVEDSAVVANDAAYKVAELKKLMADSDEEYQALFALYRAVKPKNELLPAQEQLVESIKKEQREAALARNRTLVNRISLRLNKERERLDQLKEAFDPAVQSLVEVGQLYIRLKKPDEARVALRRAKEFCKEDQRKEITYSIILTYAMQGLVQKADQAFADYQKEFPNDPKADNVSVLIAEELFRLNKFQEAFDQYQKSLKDYPTGRFADLASMKSAACKVQMGKTEEGIKILQDFVVAKKDSDFFVDAQFNLAQAYINLNQHEEAIKNYQAILANPKAQEAHASVQYRIGGVYNSIKKFAEAIEAWKLYREKYPKAKDRDKALIAMAGAAGQKGDMALAQQLFEQMIQEYPQNEEIVTLALFNIGNIHLREKRVEEMIKTFDRLVKEYLTHARASDAANRLGQHYEKLGDLAKAEEYYLKVVQKNDPKASPWSQFRLGGMYFKAATSLGAYTALNEEEKAKWNASMKKAEEAQISVIKKFPDSPQVGFALQDLLRQVLLKTDSALFNLEQAQNYFKELSEKFPSQNALQARILLAGAGLPYEKGNQAEALKAFQEIIQKYPDADFSAEDKNRYGSSLLAAKDYPKAFEVFKKLQEKFPTDKKAEADALYGQGAALLFQNKVEEAGKFFQELKVKAPGSPRIFEAEIGIGLAAELAGRLDEALAAYRKVIMDPRTGPDLKAKATLGRARIFELTGSLFPDPAKPDVPAASKEYERVASLYSSEKDAASEALYRLGLLYMKNGKPEEAKAAFQRCIEKYKGSQWASESEAKLRSI